MINLSLVPSKSDRWPLEWKEGSQQKLLTFNYPNVSAGVEFGRNQLRETLQAAFHEIPADLQSKMKQISRNQLSFREENGKVKIHCFFIGTLLNNDLLTPGLDYILNEGDSLAIKIGNNVSFEYVAHISHSDGPKKRKREKEGEKSKEKEPNSNDKSGSFYDWQKLCEQIANENLYNKKTETIKDFLKTFKGDVYLLCKLLLCRDDKRVFNIREKGFAGLLEKILQDSQCTKSAIMTDFEQGDMSKTAKKFLKMSGNAQSRSIFTLKEVDDFLETMNGLTKDSDQLVHLREFISQCTGDDIKWMWKLLDKDLKINIGAKFVLAALHNKAFKAFQNTNNLKLIIDRVQSKQINELLKKDKSGEKDEEDSIETGISLGHPVLPMLARQTASADEMMERCPNGACAEIKYDGERIQIHKDGDQFTFYSRKLKNVLAWKVNPVKEYVPQATKASKIILDGEILLMDSKTRKPLPFGTLGIHKKNGYADGTVCVFLFDILFLEGKSLLSTPYEQRRKLLEENVSVIPSRVELSELHTYQKSEKKELDELLNAAMKAGLEGLVVKDRLSTYDPNARHWNKIKKDYLEGMADSADLIVLGANYGTGRMGGKMSVFLMGVYDKKTDTYKTVCRAGNGHDDEMIERLQTELKMVKIAQDYSKIPSWLEVDKSYTPDFIIADPKKSQVWEIQGAEFTYSPKHTANSISIRFPRITKVRDDKDWKTATSMEELQHIVDTSEKIKRLLFKPPSLNTGDVAMEDDVDVVMEEASNDTKQTNQEKLIRKLSESIIQEKKETREDEGGNQEVFEMMAEEKEEKKSKKQIPKRPKESPKDKNQKTLSGFFGKTSKKKEETLENSEDDVKVPKKKAKTETKPKAVKKVKIIKKGKTTELGLAEPHPNYNEDITNILEQVGINEKNQGLGVKHKAYMKACTALQLHHKRVASGAEAKLLDGVGVKIAKKIDEILATGKLNKLEKAKADPKIQAINQLCLVTGIGPVSAKSLYETHGITTVVELQAAVESGKVSLGKSVCVGLKYFFEFQNRIPREEVAEFEEIVKGIVEKLDPEIEITICGSYRRKKASCGDIDILVTHPKYTSGSSSPAFIPQVVKELKKRKVLVDDLSLGDVTYHGVGILPNKEGAINRRLDMQWIPYDQFPFAILYFTGSGYFNIQMRRIALEKGFTLNEKEILPFGETGTCGDPIPADTEKDIFDILGMTYRLPEERDLAPNWKPTMS